MSPLPSNDDAASVLAAVAPTEALGAAAWLERLILRSAEELQACGRTRAAFGDAVGELLRKSPIENWEADRWVRGIKLRLLRMEAFFFRAGAQKRSALSLFVRNARGLNIGLRREAITQMATYVSMITDLGFPRSRTRFESGFMDVVVNDEAGQALIYAENKANARTLERLLARLTSGFEGGVPLIPPDAAPGTVDDAVMKANHIWRHRPRFFWGVSPTIRGAYEVGYTERGFRLRELERIPAAQDVKAEAAF